MNNRIVFGCARLNAGIELRNSSKLIKTALDNGVDQFDIAPSYGFGEVEDVLYKTLGKGVNNIRITTKVGLPRSRCENYFKQIAKYLLRPTNRLLNSRKTISRTSSIGKMSVDFLRSSLEETLRKLRVDKVDNILLHEPRLETITDEVVQFLENMKKEGVVSYFGTGTGSGYETAVKIGDIIQFRFEQNIKNYPVSFDGELRLHGIFRQDGVVDEKIHQIYSNDYFNCRETKIVYSTTSVNRLIDFIKIEGRCANYQYLC